MAVRNDYQCQHCDARYELQAIASVIPSVCTAEDDGVPCPGDLKRIWAPPHVGPMSNGEPPR